MSFEPKLRNPGELILSEEWNYMMNAIDGQEDELAKKVNRTGDAITGSLTIDGDVGIGTPTPGEKLTVAGVVESTTGGFKFPDGTTQATAAAISPWEKKEGDIFYNEGNVGIGTEDPKGYLHVVGPAIPGPELRKIAVFERNGKARVAINADASVHLLGEVNPTLFIEQTKSGAEKRWGISTAVDDGAFMIADCSGFPKTYFTIGPLGNVGIGMTNPQSKLEVTGDLKIDGPFQFPNTDGGFVWLTNEKFDNEAEFQNNNVKLVMARVGFLVPTPPSYEFLIGLTADQSREPPLRTKFIKQFSLNQDGNLFCAGNVGIGTTANLNSKLNVSDTKDAISGIATSDDNDNKYGVYGEASGNAGYKYGVSGEASGDDIGTKYGVHAYATGAEGIKYGVYGSATGAEGMKYGVYGSATGDSGTNFGVYGIVNGTDNYAGYFVGNVKIVGNLSKGGGGFLIDHPLDPLNKTLRHNFVESPENLCLYRGKAQLDSKGKATVKMPDYFAALTKEEEALVNLTPIGKTPFPSSYEWNKKFTAFTIYGTPDTEVAYLVLADRDDPVIHQLASPVEEEKGDTEKGKLFYPEAYGYAKGMGIHAEAQLAAEAEGPRVFKPEFPQPFEPEIPSPINPESL
jgi:hypothetical protein